MLNIKNVGQKVNLFREKMTTGNGAIHRITYSVYSAPYKALLLPDHVTSNKYISLPPEVSDVDARR